ncbi:MAG: hypothetical protein AB1489_19905 [Acidobacteriota bacterium]
MVKKVSLFAAILGIASLITICGIGFTHSAFAEDTLVRLAHQAVSEDATIAAQAIAKLRAHGPAGLQALFDAHADELKQQGFLNNTLPDKQLTLLTPTIAAKQLDNPYWQRLSAAIDAVGQQRHCYASRLYWYTDLEQAQAAARTSGKPILSLRLLGKLDEDLTCANSRFFRIALYANPEVAQMLRERFILHWKSVRPVPKITIDFGDGRKIERTITGNSIHYILDANGQPIDALPGLYGPQTFLQGLARAEKAAKEYAQRTGDAQAQFLQKYHQGRISAIETEWAKDLAKLGVKANGQDHTKLAATTTDDIWSQIAMLHNNVRLPDTSKALIYASLPPDALDASRRAVTKARVENPILRLIRNFERSIAEDTVRNEYLLHTQIHVWFANPASYSEFTKNINILNEAVYAELFLTPSSDPWLGLNLPDGYTAIENNGIVKQTVISDSLPANK